MDHLEYKDTVNKAFKTYYDKFRKMVKQDLEGDGWFLLVKDFPFKPEQKGEKFNPQLMFTAGEDIGKWKDKNLVSLYGKTSYIIGRCRKKGPVLSLLDFQEGDYIKVATESGLRKELKEYFKGTGVSVRVFKSLKVTEAVPENLTDDEQDIENEAAQEAKTVQMPEFNSLGEKRNYIMQMGKEIPAKAKAVGLDEDGEFKKNWMTLNRLVRGGKVDPALEVVQTLLNLIENAGGSKEELQTPEPAGGNIGPGIAELMKTLGMENPDIPKMESSLKELQAELKTLEDDSLPAAEATLKAAEKEISNLEKQVETHQKEWQALNKKIDDNHKQIDTLNKKADEASMEKIQELAIQNIELIEDEAPEIQTKLEEATSLLNSQYFVYSEATFNKATIESRIDELNSRIKEIQSELTALTV